MVKIILAIDDYNENLSCQTLLKKLGFDVIPIARDIQFHSATLGFLPDIVIASFKTKNVDGIALGHEAKRLISHPRVLLLYTTALEPVVNEPSKAAFDFLLSSPFDFEQLIKRTAEMARIDQDLLHEKYLKLRMRRPSKQGYTTVFGAKDITNDTPADLARFQQPSTLSSEDRNRRYQEFLSNMKDELPMKVLDHKAMTEQLSQFEEKNKVNESSIAAINAQKLEFAKALFKKS